MRIKFNPTFNAFFILSGLMIFTSCGNDKKSSTTNVTTNTTPQVEQEQQVDQGEYRAILKPLNTSLSGELTGTVEISIERDDFVVQTKVKGVAVGIKYLQNIFTASKCPEASLDVNRDGFIDISESTASTGSILIPLDSDISEQLDGMDYGPISNNNGSFVYRRSSTLSRVMADLRAIDPDPRDLIVKLPVGEEINLSGRVVMIHGVKPSESLPETVGTYAYLPKEQTLPIACGVLIRQ